MRRTDTMASGAGFMLLANEGDHAVRALWVPRDRRVARHCVRPSHGAGRHLVVSTREIRRRGWWAPGLWGCSRAAIYCRSGPSRSTRASPNRRSIQCCLQSDFCGGCCSDPHQALVVAPTRLRDQSAGAMAAGSRSTRRWHSLSRARESLRSAHRPIAVRNLGQS